MEVSESTFEVMGSTAHVMVRNASPETLAWIGLVADSYEHFGWKEILVPYASEWRPAAVAWGVVGLYLLVAVQITLTTDPSPAPPTLETGALPELLSVVHRDHAFGSS